MGNISPRPFTTRPFDYSGRGDVLPRQPDAADDFTRSTTPKLALSREALSSFGGVRAAGNDTDHGPNPGTYSPKLAPTLMTSITGGTARDIQPRCLHYDARLPRVLHGRTTVQRRTYTPGLRRLSGQVPPPPHPARSSVRRSPRAQSRETRPATPVCRRPPRHAVPCRPTRRKRDLPRPEYGLGDTYLMRTGHPTDQTQPLRFPGQSWP